MPGPSTLRGAPRTWTLERMFARYFVELSIGPERVERALSEDPSIWMTHLAEHANRRGDALLAEVGFGEDIRIARAVEIEFSPVVHAGKKMILPFRWSASGPAGMFPALDADLEVAPLGSESTQLAISARYVPPLGKLGRLIDRAVLSRVAEATVKDFLDRVASAVTEIAKLEPVASVHAAAGGDYDSGA
jgi:hypothetical protein